MQKLIYVIEWIVSFFVIWGLFYLGFFLFKKKFNPITAVIFTFIFVGFFVFLFFPYFISFFNPAIIYMPFIIFWLIYYLYKANKEMG